MTHSNVILKRITQNKSAILLTNIVVIVPLILAAHRLFFSAIVQAAPPRNKQITHFSFNANMSPHHP